jgi:biotin carboxyl carrier protein
MVKALAGGGGRGLRPVTRVGDLDNAFERARSEAEHAFGDGSLYVEQLLTHARHIEVQLVGDGTGAVIALGDRDCSLQRRRQKLIEIAPAPVPPPRGTAVQLRVNAERLQADGTAAPGAGVLARFQPPAGRSVRVDTHGYAGYAVSARYDSLLAKVIVADPAAALAGVVARARRALDEFIIDGVPTNIALLQALLSRPEVADGQTHTAFVEEHASELWPDSVSDDTADGQPDETDAPDGTVTVRAAMPGVVVEVAVGPGSAVAAGGTLLVVEAMKMEHVITAPRAGVVHDVTVRAGDTVLAGAPIAYLDAHDGTGEQALDRVEINLDDIRADLAETLQRRRLILDEGRPDAVDRRHAADRRTARENIADLCDDGTFTEYGGLTIAAQRRRRALDDLIRRTPADGLVTGTGRVAGLACAVMSYDYTVLAGTQGIHNHRKTDRLLELAARQRLPLVVFAEGGGGRPGDTDTPGFMVGPDSERDGAVRRFGAMFIAGARLTAPLCTVVLRKGYGLGAMAMAGGDLKAPLVTVSWPTGEFGGMGLEGGVRLGYRAELNAIGDAAEREARYRQLVAEAYERGKALSAATVFELDDVIDPAETRGLISRTLSAALDRR